MRERFYSFLRHVYRVPFLRGVGVFYFIDLFDENADFARQPIELVEQPRFYLLVAFEGRGGTAS